MHYLASVSYTHLDVYKRQVLERIKKYRHNLKSHVERMAATRIANQASEYRLVGPRDRGKPWEKWSETL